MSQIEFAGLPDRRGLHRQFRKVYGPRGKSPLLVHVLADSFVGVWTHFDETLKRLRPCTGENACDFCKAGQHRRWMGYLPAMRRDTHEVCIAEVTEGAARALQAKGFPPESLRGKLLHLYRQLPHRNAPVHVHVEPSKMSSALPPAFDPVPHLLRLWGWTEKHEGEIKQRSESCAVDVRQLAGGVLQDGRMPA